MMSILKTFLNVPVSLNITSKMWHIDKENADFQVLSSFKVPVA